MEHLYFLALSRTAIKELPQSIYALPRLKYLYLQRCAKLVTLPPDLPTNSNISLDNFGSVAIPNLGTMLFDECNLSDIFLCNSNIESLPACIGKFVWLDCLDLRGCKRLREISELPPKIRSIDVGGCILLEIFPTLSEMILVDGDMRLIHTMIMYGCQRLCEKLALDVSMMASVLLHQAGKCKDTIDIFLPGSEVPNWFSCRKDGRVIDPDSICEICIEIPRTFKWKNTGLVFCAAFKFTENFSGECGFYICTEVNGVEIMDSAVCLFGSKEMDAAHVWLHYIPLPARIKSQVDEGGDQSKPYLCRVGFWHYEGEWLHLNGCGVHLGNFRKPEDGGEDDDDVGGEDGDEDDDDVGDGDEDDDDVGGDEDDDDVGDGDEDDDDVGGEDGGEDDDDVGGEVGPRKKKRMLAIKS